MIDAEKDPEGYARYMAERQEKRKKERLQQRLQEDNQLQSKSMKVSDSKDFKVGMKVVVVGLQNNPDKNGSLGTLFTYVTEKQRWTVEFHNGSRNNFKVENLQLVDEMPAASASTGDDNGDIPTPKIYISNLSADTTHDHLIALFSKIGLLAREPVLNAKGKSKGFEDEWPFAVKLYKPGHEGGDACVQFVDKAAAKAAINVYNGHVLRGSIIGVEYAGGGGGAKERAVQKARDRSRSKERLAELATLTKKLKDQEVPAELRGVFGSKERQDA